MTCPARTPSEAGSGLSPVLPAGDDPPPSDQNGLSPPPPAARPHGRHDRFGLPGRAAAGYSRAAAAGRGGPAAACLTPPEATARVDTLPAERPAQPPRTTMAQRSYRGLLIALAVTGL